MTNDVQIGGRQVRTGPVGASPSTDEAINARPLLQITRGGFKAGFIQSIPLAISVGGYGLLVGVLAKADGFTSRAAAAMSLIVFAGTAQFAALDIWKAKPTLAVLFLETLVINSRYFLEGLTLEPWYKNASQRLRYLSAFFMIDESWALSVSEFEGGGRDAGFMVGSGCVMYISWGLATYLGYELSIFLAYLGNPETLALDVVLPCVLITLLVPRWKGMKSSFPPWAVAAAVSAVAYHFASTKGWAVLLAGSSGALVGWMCEGGGV